MQTIDGRPVYAATDLVAYLACEHLTQLERAYAGAFVLILLVLVAFASLEAFLAFCTGCVVFGWLMKAGLVPDEVCAECADLSLRRRP